MRMNGCFVLPEVNPFSGLTRHPAVNPILQAAYDDGEEL